MMFLKLIVAGHSTLYITRTEGWFWRRPWPAPLLFSATFGTEILGTLIAVYGILITPIAYISGSMGTLVGADLLNLGQIRGLGAPVASIGGAGTFDGIFLASILAVVLAALPTERSAGSHRHINEEGHHDSSRP